MDWRISIHRKILDRERYDNINTKVLFIHLLLTVNIEDKQWRWKTIERGSRITSIWKLSEEIWLTVKQTRLALDRLINTWEIGKQTTNEYSKFSISKYDDYQSREWREKTNERQTEGKQRATTKEDKNIRTKEYIDDFQEFKERWNNVPNFWIAKKWLPKVIKDNQKLIDMYIKKRKEYTFEEVIDWLQKYVNYMDKVQKDDWWFYTHRFSMIEFLGREKWLDKYINFTS